MTCIVAIKSQGTVYIGGDSCATHGTVPKLLANGKVWRIGEFVMGGSGTARVNELIRFNFRPPRIKVDISNPAQLDRYMNTSFVSALRSLLSKNECIRKDKGDDDEYGEDFGGSLLVGVRGEIYLVDCSFAAFRTVDDYNATGSGHEVALGVLDGLEDSDKTPEDKLRRALLSAERRNEGVRAPFTIKSIPKCAIKTPAKRGTLKKKVVDRATKKARHKRGSASI